MVSRVSRAIRRNVVVQGRMGAAMRKPRVILFDDDRIVLDVLTNLFVRRNYEVCAYPEPFICPVYGIWDTCSKPYPCSDLMIADYRMPHMNGLDLFLSQARLGCKLTPKNKALISGFLCEDGIAAVRRLGAAYFEKPFDFDDLSGWADECESRMDLSLPIAIRRREERTACSNEVRYQLCAGADVRSGHLVNRSRSGLCMKVSVPLRTDHSLVVHAPTPLPPSTAMVRWTKADGDDYLVGLQCFFEGSPFPYGNPLR